MPVTRIKNNQITDATINAASKLADTSVTAGKLVDNLTYGSNLTITGNLTVNGATTTVSTTNTTVEDAVMVLNSDATGSYANDAGVYLERGDNTSVFMGYDGSATQFALAETDSAGTVTTVNITDYADLRLGGLTADDAITATGNVTGGNLITAALVQGATVTATGNVNGNNVVSTNDVTTATVTASSTVTATANITGGNLLTGGVVTATGAVTGGSLTDGTATISSGAITGATSGSFSTTLTATGNITGGNLITTNLTSTGDLTVLASGTIEMNENVIGNVADPVADQDAATKAYVDSQVASGFDITDGTTSQNITSGDTLTINGTANEVTVAVSATDTVTIGLPDDVIIAGNLTVQGTTTTVDSTTTIVADPIMQLGRGANNAALTSDDAKDRGISMYYYEGSEKVAFMGFDTTTNTYLFVPDATISGEVVSGSAGNATFGHVTITGATSSGDVTVTGNVDATNFNTGNVVITDSTVTATGNVQGGNIVSDADVTTVSVTASGAITGSTTATITGNITGGNLLTSNGVESATLSTSGEATLASATVSDLTSGRVVLAGTSGALEDSTNLTFNGSTLAVTGAVTASTTATVTGNITGGNLLTAGVLETAAITETGSEVVVNDGGSAFDFRVEGDTNQNLLLVDGSADQVLIGGTSGTTDVTFKVATTDAMMAPIGNTAQRPSTGVVGMLRFNTTTDSLEQYSSADGWESVGAVTFTVIASETFSGDNSTVAFTLSDSQTTASCIVSINGVVQLPTTAYGVSGTTLTFTEAPLSGDTIEVRKITTTSTVTNIASSGGEAEVSAETSGEVDVKGNLMPTADATYSIGNATVGWTTVYAEATSAQYADLAEKYTADADYEPGTIVHFGGDAEVTECDQDNCTKVAGVVSTSPAYRMNDGLEAEHTAMVALVGRVPTKVQGPVAKGDMMVSAGNGKARAEADPKVGAVIGKALEDFNGEEGVIEVVVGKH
jgi:hypothetical protein